MHSGSPKAVSDVLISPFITVHHTDGQAASSGFLYEDWSLANVSKLGNKKEVEFINEYCSSDGAIIWEKLVQFNSGKNI